MKQIKVSELVPWTNIIDQSDHPITVEQVWEDQGPGLGVMVIGKTFKGEVSRNRYLFPDELVEVIDNLY